MNLWPLSRVEVRSCQRLYHLYWFSRNDLHIRILQSLLPCFAHTHTQFIESAESGQISSQCRNGWSCLALGLALGYEPAVQKQHNPSGLTDRYIMIYPFTVPQAKKLNNSQAFSLVLYMYIELFWGGNAQIRQWVGTGHGYRGCVTLNGGKIEDNCQLSIRSLTFAACDRNLSGSACAHLPPSLGPGSRRSSTAGSILYRASSFWGLATAPMNCLRRILPH